MVGIRKGPTPEFGNGGSEKENNLEFASNSERVKERATQKESVMRNSKDKIRELKRSELVGRLDGAKKELSKQQGVLRDIKVLQELVGDMNKNRMAVTSIVANLPIDSNVDPEDVILLLGALGRKDDEQLVKVLDFMSSKVESRIKDIDNNIDEIEKEIMEFQYPQPEKEPEKIVEEKVEEKVVEKVEEFKISPEKAVKNLMNRIQSNLPTEVSPGTDGLNRMQQMRYVYVGENVDSTSFSGDQIFLKTAIRKVAEYPRFTTSKEEVAVLLNNLDKITDRQAIQILAAYQETKNLKVDGKFGPKTYDSLRADIGRPVKDRSTGKFADKYEG